MKEKVNKLKRLKFDKAIKYKISTITNYSFALKRTFNNPKKRAAFSNTSRIIIHKRYNFKVIVINTIQPMNKNVQINGGMNMRNSDAFNVIRSFNKENKAKVRRNR